MPGPIDGLSAAAAAVAVGSVVRAWQRYAFLSSAHRPRWAALTWLGFAGWAGWSAVARITGWGESTGWHMVPVSMAVVGVVGACGEQAGIAIVRRSWLVPFVAVVGGVAAVGSWPAGRRWIALPHYFVPGGWSGDAPLMTIAVVMVVMALGTGAVTLIGATAQAVGPTRRDILGHGSVLAMTGLTVAVVYVVPSLRPAIDWFFLPGAVLFAVLDRNRDLRPLPPPLAAVFDHVPDALAVVGVDGLVIDANRPGEALLVPVHHTRTGSIVRRLRPEVAAVVEDGERPVTVGGRVLAVRRSSVRENGVLVAHVLVARDVTELTRLRTELVGLVESDPLTGARNRRHLAPQLTAMVAEAHRAHRPLCVVLVDLDNLKELNDARGHRAGDRVLVDVAAVLLATCGPGDLVVRYGGDEFLVVLTGTDARAALERGLLWQRLVTARTGDAGVTLSIGIAETVAAATPDSLMQVADAELYRAKRAGRNRVAAGRLGLVGAGVTT